MSKATKESGDAVASVFESYDGANTDGETHAWSSVFGNAYAQADAAGDTTYTYTWVTACPADEPPQSMTVIKTGHAHVYTYVNAGLLAYGHAEDDPSLTITGPGGQQTAYAHCHIDSGTCDDYKLASVTSTFSTSPTEINIHATIAPGCSTGLSAAAEADADTGSN
jgi:hypothetical protein